MSGSMRNGQAGLNGLRAFTLIEMLVVISIIVLLVSILLPTLRAARNEGTKSVCISNLREISFATSAYDGDQSDTHLFPWYQIPPHGGYPISYVTPWAFGGFRAPNPGPRTQDSEPEGHQVDSTVYPAQIRPLNKYADPTACADPENYSDRGRDIIKMFICGGDRTRTTTTIGDSPLYVNEEEAFRSHEANGSSYSLNTRWLQGHFGFSFTPELNNPLWRIKAFAHIAKKMTGGDAARFALWVEQGFYSATYCAAPTLQDSGAVPQRGGWHRKFSSWNIAFADGHVDSGYFDTRTIFGLSGTIWEPGVTTGPPP